MRILSTLAVALFVTSAAGRPAPPPDDERSAWKGQTGQTWTLVAAYTKPGGGDRLKIPMCSVTPKIACDHATARSCEKDLMWLESAQIRSLLDGIGADTGNYGYSVYCIVPEG